MEISELKAGPVANTFRTVSFKPSKGNPTKLTPSTLAQFQTADGTYDVVTDPSAKAWLLLDLNKRNEVAASRLESQGFQLWAEPGREELDKATAFYDDLFTKAQAMFPQLSFQRVETQYFVFYTDMPAAQVGGYIANLDKMYDQLCALFGVPSGTNIWLGKCPVIAFLHTEAFQQFEATHMNNPMTQGVAGLNHQWSDGRVVITCARGDNPVFFAVILVHETAHGFLHRIRSNGRIPPWMNEGISEWVSAVVVPQSDHVANRMAEALPQIRTTGSLGGDFLDDEGMIQRWQYGVAATLTQLLVSTDANAYRGMITAIKEGYTWREALEQTYGISASDLATAYGRQIGIPGLRP
ncbi:MAG: hypothetical protein B7Z55_07020 [Planctomycetales bacterium 12-60-4]|nr:MAG: hypothetical protein B7Z55_07020 [Planctomycetales bacterium 12-60-4]